MDDERARRDLERRVRKMEERKNEWCDLGAVLDRGQELAEDKGMTQVAHMLRACRRWYDATEGSLLRPHGHP